MDINFKSIEEKITHLVHPSRALHTHTIASPVRDWKIILACTGVGVICAAAFAGVVYFSARVTPTADDGMQSAAAHSKINDAEIHTVLSAFETRSVIHGQVRAGFGGLVDPSR